MKKRPAIPNLDGGPQTILLVEDVAKTSAFYQEILRLEPKDGDRHRYMEFGPGEGGTLLLVDREGSIAPMASKAAAVSTSLTFFIPPDGYRRWKKWLVEHGVEIALETKWVHGGRSLYVNDPDGRRLEFKAPAEAQPAGGKATAPAPVATAAPPAKASVTPKDADDEAKTRAGQAPAPGRAPSAEPTSTGVQTSPIVPDAAKGAPTIDGVLETILYTENLPRARTFYREVMGLAPMAGDSDRFQAFDAGAGRVLLLFKRGSALDPQPAAVGMIPPHDGYGPQHVAFAIAADDYHRWCARLQAHRIAIESETNWDGGGRSVFFRDPDKHLVELATPGIWPNY